MSRGAETIRPSSVAKAGPWRSRDVVTSLRCARKRGEEIEEMRRNAPTCRSSGRTFDNELYFARRRARSTWESRSVPEIDREATRTHSRSPPKTAIHFRHFSRALSTVNRSLIYVVGFLLKSRKKGVTSAVETVDVTCHAEKFAENEN